MLDILTKKQEKNYLSEELNFTDCGEGRIGVVDHRSRGNPFRGTRKAV